MFRGIAALCRRAPNGHSPQYLRRYRIVERCGYQHVAGPVPVEQLPP